MSLYFVNYVTAICFQFRTYRRLSPSYSDVIIPVIYLYEYTPQNVHVSGDVPSSLGMMLKTGPNILPY